MSVYAHDCLFFFTVWTITPSSLAQGVSFSYLIPKNGYLTAPVSPFSIRGLGVGDVIGIETGATLYNIPGLAMDDLPFDYNRPLIGPHFAALVPVDIYLKIPMNEKARSLNIASSVAIVLAESLRQNNLM